MVILGMTVERSRPVTIESTVELSYPRAQQRPNNVPEPPVRAVRKLRREGAEETDSNNRRTDKTTRYVH